jgi:hypothetical protein
MAAPDQLCDERPGVAGSVTVVVVGSEPKRLRPPRSAYVRGRLGIPSSCAESWAGWRTTFSGRACSNSGARITAGPYVRAMGTVSWPEGIDARSIDTGDADAWAELLAAKEKIDQEGENYGPQDLLDQLNDPHVDAALDTIGLWAEGRMVAYGKAHAAER